MGLPNSSKYSEKWKISFKLVDINGDEITAKELVDRYFSNPADYFIIKANKKDAIENKEQKNGALKQGHLEEHFSMLENDDKLQSVSKNDEKNIQVAGQHIEENVLLPEKEQIEHSKSPVKVLSSAEQDLEGTDPEYVYENEDDERKFGDQINDNQ